VKKPYVAIVDDDSAFANYLRTFLSLRGYDTRAYSRGDAILAAVKQGDPPDIVLLDVMMPVMDGYEVCRRIRQDEKTAQLPVIMVTALDKESDREMALAAGANEFLSKPVEDNLLLPAIRRILQNAPAK